ncbi:MAG: dockerin type I repeat-containing protein, partial [Armatimonadota bacterium]
MFRLRYRTLLIAALVVLALPSAPCWALSLPSGDVSGDGKVNIADAMLILRSSVGLRQATSEELARADLNQDGKLTIYDAIVALGIIVGTTPPMETLASYPDSLGPAYFYAGSDASLTKAQIPTRPSVVYTPGKILSASGF